MDFREEESCVHVAWERGGAGWWAGDAGSPVPRGGAAAFQTNRERFENEIFDSNILLLFYKIKIRFSCMKIRTEVSCEATN